MIIAIVFKKLINWIPHLHLRKLNNDLKIDQGAIYPWAGSSRAS